MSRRAAPNRVTGNGTAGAPAITADAVGTVPGDHVSGVGAPRVGVLAGHPRRAAGG